MSVGVRDVCTVIDVGNDCRDLWRMFGVGVMVNDGDCRKKVQRVFVVASGYVHNSTQIHHETAVKYDKSAPHVIVSLLVVALFACHGIVGCLLHPKFQK